MTSARAPRVGARIPRSGGAPTRALGRAALRLLGWRVAGDIPDVPKLVMVAAPHSTNWDFVVGIAAKFALNLEVLWLGKHTLFAPPFGAVMRALGGMPVDRSASSDVVGQVLAEFARRDQLVLALAPEGTRKRVKRWRSGFYHIAHGAGVPILPIAIDWGTRTLVIGAAFATTGDMDADLATLRAFFARARRRDD